MSETRSLSEIEIRALFGELAITWRSLARFLAHTGLRVSEALTLRPRDVDRDCGAVVIRAAVSKTRTARRVPVNASAQRILRFVVLRSRPGAPLVWAAHRRAPIRSFQTAIARAATRAGIAGRVSPHTLRHTFASRLAGAGVRLDVIQALLGHARLTSTQRYLHTTPEDLAAAVRILE